MQRVAKRLYDVDAQGRRFLAYRPGDLISAAESERLEALADPEPEKPRGWWTSLERRDEAPAPPPAKPLSRMKLDELRAVCAAENIDAGEANTRAEHIAAIEAARAGAQRRA